MKRRGWEGRGAAVVISVTKMAQYWREAQRERERQRSERKKTQEQRLWLCVSQSCTVIGLPTLRELREELAVRTWRWAQWATGWVMLACTSVSSAAICLPTAAQDCRSTGCDEQMVEELKQQPHTLACATDSLANLIMRRETGAEDTGEMGGRKQEGSKNYANQTWPHCRHARAT